MISTAFLDFNKFSEAQQGGLDKNTFRRPDTSDNRNNNLVDKLSARSTNKPVARSQPPADKPTSNSPGSNNSSSNNSRRANSKNKPAAVHLLAVNPKNKLFHRPARSTHTSPHAPTTQTSRSSTPLHLLV
ncbi:MAG: hypothetical protein RIT27_1102 [Pseudomonadota bacterium]